MRDAGEEKDDVSPTLYKMLEEIESPGIKAGRTNLIKIENGVIAEESKAAITHFSAAQPYIEHYEDRFNENNSILFVHKYDEACIPCGTDFGRKLNRVLKKARDWVLFRTDTDTNTSEIGDLIKKYILNPGTLHLGDGFALFSKNALSLRKFGFDRIAHTESFQDIIDMWQKDKVFRLKDLTKEDYLSFSRASIQPDKRYVIWGTGLCGSFIAEAVTGSGALLAFCVDKDSCKNGVDFYGATIYSPQYLLEHREDYDLLIIAHYTQFQEIKDEALELDVPEEKIIMPYEV